MFLVEMSYNTIKEEITDLNVKTKRKQNALVQSKDDLEKDKTKLEKFIEDDNNTTRDSHK